MIATLPVNALRPGQVKHGFAVTRVSHLEYLRAVAVELEHHQTGAQVLHVHNDDAENLFAIAFRTPPGDDTGLPHILEHAVLAGSKRFPVKDPFVEMVKMSMATFINAMTYADKTVYPVASNVKKDFYNLATVYCDAVFHPRLTPETFKQEGHHLEVKNENGKASLIVKGIVFNEMKGAYSSADEYIDRVTNQKLFPDTPYGKDSGGDPLHIPDLQFKDFKRFYRDLYHPSNAFIFLYGNIPTQEHLRFLQKQLRGFRRRRIDTGIPVQRRWKRPRLAQIPYPVGGDEPIKKKTFITMHWIVGSGTDVRDVIAFMVLDIALLGNHAAPLRRAIVDSHLGEDLMDSGYSAGRLEATFQVGIKGSDPGKRAKFEKLVLDTLRRLVKDGIPAKQLEAAFHQIAYRYREIQSMFPLWQMERAYASWIYGADPLAYLGADRVIRELRQEWEADPRLFGRLIQERLIANAHRVTLTAVPDRKLLARRDAGFNRRLTKLMRSLKPAKVRALQRDAARLEQMQSKPNSPKALASLPQLKVRELPLKPRHIPTTVERLAGGHEILRNDVFANGVSYLHLDVDLSGLPEELYPFLALYTDGIAKLGAGGCDYAEMSERIAAHTGGVRFWAWVNRKVGDAAVSMRRGRFSTKFLDEKAGDALGVLRDLLFDLNPGDMPRLRDIMTQSKAEHRSSLVPGGLDMAGRRAARGICAECHIADLLGGLPQTRMIERLANRFDEERERIAESIVRIRDFMLAAPRLTFSFTGSDSSYAKVRSAAEGWLAHMHDERPVPRPDTFTPIANTGRSGLAAPMDVAFCARVMPAPALTHPDSPLLNVGSRMLSLGYMWDEVRIKGGAYGGGSGYNGVDRTWQLYSYRDPWITRTYKIFDGLLEHVRKAKWAKADIDRAVIGTAKSGERPIRPSEATSTALWRHVNGDTPQMREQRHAAVLAATPGEVKRALLEHLEANWDKGGQCVVSSRAKIEQANKEDPEHPFEVEDIMLT